MQYDKDNLEFRRIVAARSSRLHRLRQLPNSETGNFTSTMQNPFNNEIAPPVNSLSGSQVQLIKNRDINRNFNSLSKKVEPKLIQDNYYHDYCHQNSSEMHRFRKIKSQDNSIYLGEWKHGKKHGLGILSFTNGCSYSGEFRSDAPNGFIIFKSSNGYSHEGYITDYIFQKGSVILISNLEKSIQLILHQDFDTRTNICQGICQITCKSLGIILYQGEFKDYNQEGYGIINKNGVIYQGKRENKVLNGFCEILYKDGTKFAGTLRNGQRQGIGSFLSKDKILNVAYFSNNFKNGCCMSRKQTSSNEILIYECFNYGFKSARIENRPKIEEYVNEFYPEHMLFLKLDLEKLSLMLDKVDSGLPLK